MLNGHQFSTGRALDMVAFDQHGRSSRCRAFELKEDAIKSSPLTCRGRRGVADFHAHHLSVSPAFDGGILSPLRRRFTFAAPKRRQLPIIRLG